MLSALETKTQLDTADRIYDAFESVIPALASRWLDEKEYEDIAQYRTVIEQKLAKEFPQARVVGMTRNPFGFKFRTTDRIMARIFIISCTAKGQYRLRCERSK